MNKIINKIYVLGIVFLILSVASCRKESDNLFTYDHADTIVFDKAWKSFAEQFKVMWNGMSQNYGIWDVEMDYGVNWDAVYDEYLPQFEALDKQEAVSNDELKALMDKVLAPLHDGHLYVELYNYKTKEYVRSKPSLLRNASRSDYNVYTNNVNTSSYNDQIIEGYYAELSANAALDEVMTTGVKWLMTQIQNISSKTTPTEMELFRLQHMKDLLDGLNSIPNLKTASEQIALNDTLATKYAFLNVPGLQMYTPKYYDDDSYITVQYLLFKDNIAYLRFNQFYFSLFLIPEMSEETFAKPTAGDAVLIEQVREAWQRWFSAIQELKQAGTLGGVIIDLRNNFGGYLSDYQYVLGALLPSGGYEYGKTRYKQGTGRLDYTPMMPQIGATYAGTHEVINEPIAVLTNCRSISMAEMTAQGAKQLDNARVIGKHTWGGVCGLNGNESFSKQYAGYVGVRNQTPVFVYIPCSCGFTMEGKSLEGIGIEPDIDVDLDLSLLSSTGHDSQLDRALEYIRTGK